MMRRKGEGQFGLSVETSVPYGNACDVEFSQMSGQRVVSFAADPRGGPECMWFCFRLRVAAQSTAKRRIKLVLKHVTNMLGAGSAPPLMPVVRYDGRDWDRLPAGKVEWLQDGRARLGWSIEPPTTFADIAFCYPYGLPEVEALVADTRGYWKVDTIGVSQEGRPLIRLSNGAGKPGDDRRGLFLIARQHSGETPGSWVLDGLLRAIAEAGERAPLVWCVPLADRDGIERGDYGKDRFPYDLNRAWGAKPMRHETLVSMGHASLEGSLPAAACD